MERSVCISVTVFLVLVAAISFQKFVITPSEDQSNVSIIGLPEDVQFIELVNKLGMKTSFSADCTELSCRLIIENGVLSKLAMKLWVWSSVATIFLGLVAAVCIPKFLTGGSREDVQIIVFSKMDFITRFKLSHCSKSTWKMMIRNGLLPPEFISGLTDIKLKSSSTEIRGWHLFYKEKENTVTMYLVRESRFPNVIKQLEVSVDRSWYVHWVYGSLTSQLFIKVPVAGNSSRIVAVIEEFGPGLSSLEQILELTRRHTSGPREDVQLIVFSQMDLKTRFGLSHCSKSTWKLMVQSGLLPPEFISGVTVIKLKSVYGMNLVSCQGGYLGWYLFYKETDNKITMYLVRGGRFPRVVKQEEVSDYRRWNVCWYVTPMICQVLIIVPGAVGSGDRTRIVAVIQEFGPGLKNCHQF